MREAITYSKLPDIQSGDQSTFKIPLNIPVTVPEEDEPETAGSGAGNKSTSAQEQEKLSDEEPVLMKDVGMKDSQLLDGDITVYEQFSVIQSLNITEIWMKNKFAQADTYENAQVRDTSNRNFIVVTQLLFSFMMSVIH